MLEKAQQLIILHAIYTQGSFSKAAKTLHCSVSHVSKQLAKLEDDLEVQLIHRTSRQLSVTEAGFLLLEQASKITNLIDNLDNELEMLHSEVAGVVRIALAQSFGTMHIIPLIEQLKHAYPKLEVEISLVDYRVDMLKDNIDLWITNVENLPQGYVAQRIADSRFVLAASPDYLIKHTSPLSPKDLLRHNCITYQSRERVFNDWLFYKDAEALTIPVKGNYKVDLAEAVRDAVINGWGIGYLATYLLRDEFINGKLVQLIPNWNLGQQMPFYAVYPKREHLPFKTRAIIDFIKNKIGYPPHWDNHLNQHIDLL
ncbi:LysR family transcriptional regulator [Shewanella sp. 10N.7]|uniref:LysR family transcriptional regulator n=1 Tax=Shewanella sp. 10N.7 TaxID=2885093 RepID=UPI001E48E17D|nr:LysR family transcriptional regulator [Shewanella sp. 10N.7]MCC4832342.1 LysR family transcriptional regulator [Shewanella sp. 10N.7]